MSDTEFKITISANGSYRVEGGPELVDADGNPVETREGRPFFLCRCGHSENKPFCDGSHGRHEWDPTLADR